MAETIAVGALIASAASALGTAVQATTQVKQVFWDPLRVKDMLSSKTVDEIIVALNDAVQKLDTIKKDFKHKELRNKRVVPSQRYLEWVRKVDEIAKQVNNLIATYNKKKVRVASSCFPLFVGLKDDFKNMYIKVNSLGQESYEIEDKMFVGPLPERVVRRNGPVINFGTPGKQIEEILDLLGSSDVKKIGVHGKVGIGKTAMMGHLNDHEKVARTFDIVIWLTVSSEGSRENFSREHLQHAIMTRLNLNNVDEVTSSNADKVAKRISMELQGMKYLLLLDDVKECLNLKNIGIPESNDGCKIVLTTRLRPVCYSMVDHTINVTYLSEDEAWKMFQDVIKSFGVLENPKIQKLAWRVCKECCGLPLLIYRIARTFIFKNTEIFWSDGLNSWRMWPEKDCEGIKEIFNMLRYCYDDLDDESRQKCFLYGALYPEGSGINIDNLLECWAAEKLLGGHDSITQKSLKFGHHILNHLKNVSLLEECEFKNHVTMDKFIRQLALYIIAQGDGERDYMVETGKGLTKPPEVKSWTEKKRVSFGDNKLKYLPDSPNCSMLSTLILQRNLSLETIPQSFFEHMIELRVLDVSDTGIRELPSSLSTSIELKVLYLNNCKSLVELPTHIVEKLAHLEALDIVGSGVNNIPSDIKKLTKLRRLRVSFSESGNRNATHEVNFNYEVISELSTLEELVIDVKSLENQSNDVIKRIIKAVATLQEFKSLKFGFSDKVVDVIEVVGSQNLRIRVPDATILLSFIERSSWRSVQDIENFEFYIGSKMSEHPQLPDFCKHVKYVKYCEVEGTRNSPILKVLAEADAFELVDNNNIKQLSDSELTNMKGIQSCLIEGCDAIETIVGTSDIVVLPRLEHLSMKNLTMLKGIFKGPFQPGSLTKLTTLELTGCRSLVTIFPPDSIQQLCEIQRLKIEKCDEIVEIIPTSGAGGILLPKLEKMILLDMEKLESICASETLWPSLEKLEIVKCPGLLKLPFNKDNAKILKRMKIEKCHEIVEIIPTSGAGGILLPKLEKMILLDMEKLDSICASETLWPSLEKLEIFKCPGLLKLPFNKDNAKILKRIDADPKWWGKLQFDQNNENKEWLQKLHNARYPKNAS